MQAAFVEPEDDSPHQMSHKVSQPNSHQIQLSVPERLEDVLSSAVLDTKLLNSQVGSLVAVDSPCSGWHSYLLCMTLCTPSSKPGPCTQSAVRLDLAPKIAVRLVPAFKVPSAWSLQSKLPSAWSLHSKCRPPGPAVKVLLAQCCAPGPF